MRVPITKPWFGPEEFHAIQRPLQTGWVVQGPEVLEFEREFAKFVGVDYALATTSCTTALHAAVVALGIKPGDEVIVPAFTWVSTANVVELSGGRPVFVDVDFPSFNISTRAIEAAITPHTVGIIPVHLFGLCADMTRVMEIATARDLWVLEDAACGFGALHDGQHAGSFGDAGAFSFHPRKSITTGEGGMVTTNKKGIATLVSSLRDHGASESDLSRHASGRSQLPEFDRLGFNFRMTDFQGALGRVQLKKGGTFLAARRALAERYDEMLSPISWLIPPTAPEGFVHGYQAYVCRIANDDSRANPFDSALRDRLMDTLGKRGVAVRPGTHAAALTTFFRQKYSHEPHDFPTAAEAEAWSLALPLYPQMDLAEQEYVVRAIEECGRAEGFGVR